jgi:hypothetical protein
MNKKRVLFLVVGIVLLVVFMLIVGKWIGGSIHGSRYGAAAGYTPISMPVDFFSQEFASSAEVVPVGGLAVGGLSDALLKTSVWRTLLDYEQKQNCTDLTSQTINVAEINEADSYWVEDWTVDACGKIQVFKVRFWPDQVGGTIYQISHP